jgi:GTP-binding protein
VAISASSKENTKDFIDELYKIVIKERAKQAKKKAKKSVNDIPVLRLKDNNDSWRITKSSDGYLVSGHRIEKFASRTDFDNVQSEQRLLDIMKKMGIMHEFARLKVKPGTKVKIGNHGSVEI